MVAASPAGHASAVPRIAEFYGIAIYMYYQDHEPPHVHAKYGGHGVVLAVRSLRVLKGRLPPRALALVRRWARMNRRELEANWTRARGGRTLRPVSPLE
jgi:phosphomannomutase